MCELIYSDRLNAILISHNIKHGKNEKMKGQEIEISAFQINNISMKYINNELWTFWDFTVYKMGHLNYWQQTLNATNMHEDIIETTWTLFYLNLTQHFPKWLRDLLYVLHYLLNSAHLFINQYTCNIFAIGLVSKPQTVTVTTKNSHIT